MLKLLSATLLASSLLTSLARAETIKLTFLGVGDIYNFEGGKTRGGMARLNAVARAERAANPNTIYVMAGDMLSPSLMSGFDKGENMILLSNVVPYDLAVPGNHEFDAGPENFVAKIKISKFPWSAINITTAEGKAPEGLGAVVLKDISGVKVALIPVADDESPTESTTKDLKFTSTTETAIAAAKLARKNGADLVVGVVHAAHSGDQIMFNSKAFDILLSGHDHDFITQYNGFTAYVETSTEANFLAPLDVTVNVEVKDGKRNVSWIPLFRFIDTSNVKPDPETQIIVDQYKAQLGSELDVVLGKTEGPMDSRRDVVRKQESAMGNLIADATRDAVGADIAITNGGGIRGDKQYAAGSTITRRDIFTELPFGNVTVLAEVSGQQVLAALENGFSMVDDGAGRFPQVSGLIVTADLKQPAGARVVSVSVNGKTLDPAATYKLATNDFMLNGGDGYAGLATKVIIPANGGKLMANDVMALIKKLGGITAKVEGRITFK